MPPLMKGNSCHLLSLDNETRRTEAATPRCSYIAPSSSSGATHASSCFQRPAPSVLPPSAVSRRCCVAVAPPERSLHVLAIPFALLSHPLPVGPRVSPLVPRDRAIDAGASAWSQWPARPPPAIVRHHALPLRSQIWPRLCFSVLLPALPPEGCLSAAACMLPLRPPIRDRRGRTRVVPTIRSASLSSFASVYCRCVASAPFDFPALSWR